MSQKRSAKDGNPRANPATGTNSGTIAQTHFRFGWWALLFFLLLGLLLEAMHGFKIGAYLGVSNETRRLLWTLAHAHGGLLALIQIAFAATVRLNPGIESKLSLASRSLMAAQVLLPLGFFLGGAFLYDGDPGLGIFLVPPGALLLVLGVGLTARQLGDAG